jgi:alkanesulfonate monooxygenase SsuD/methylene tetrahydromethanopterin reductase-like flavin-dependent oxidoreductase (luciferase family)
VDGEIMDIFAVTVRNHLLATVADAANTPEFTKIYGGHMTPEQFEAFEDARSETARLGWEPFMHNPSLPYLLRGVKIPTLLMWGARDGIVPRSRAPRSRCSKAWDIARRWKIRWSSSAWCASFSRHEPARSQRSSHMQVGYFTERPYRWLPEEEILKNGGFFAVSNRLYDREKAADDYHYYLDENCYAEDLGFDVVALNEHHGNPICMGSVMNVEAAVLAYRTKRVRLVLIGNPLPVIKHPLRMAEELAEIDLISRGRLVTGWVRGAGSEQFFNNANPAYNREMFNEAHDFIVQAWTRPGPWRYEGKHFHYRHVNPWALPYQKPHPPMWIPGTLSPETVQWCAEHRYPYIGLGTPLVPTCDLWDFYADEAAKHGYQAGPENFGYMIATAVAETEEKAQAIAEGFVYGGGQNAFSAPQYTMPPGYNSKAAIRILAKQQTSAWLGVSGEKVREQMQGADAGAIDYAEVRRKLHAALLRGQQNMQVIVGTPEMVIPKIKTIMSVLRIGIFIILSIQGPVADDDRRTSMRLFAQQVIPAIKAHAKQIDLLDPFERAPGSVMLAPGAKRAPVVSRERLKELSLK